MLLLNISNISLQNLQAITIAFSSNKGANDKIKPKRLQHLNLVITLKILTNLIQNLITRFMYTQILKC